MAVPRLGLDFIGQINSPSSKGHRFVLVATDYFTKWTEAVPLKNMTHREVICDTSGVSTRKYNHCTQFKLKRKMWEINSKRRGQIKVKVYKRN